MGHPWHLVSRLLTCGCSHLVVRVYAERLVKTCNAIHSHPFSWSLSRHHKMISRNHLIYTKLTALHYFPAHHHSPTHSEWYEKSIRPPKQLSSINRTLPQPNHPPPKTSPHPLPSPFIFLLLLLPIWCVQKSRIRQSIWVEVRCQYQIKWMGQGITAYGKLLGAAPTFEILGKSPEERRSKWRVWGVNMKEGNLGGRTGVSVSNWVDGSGE